MSDHVAHDYVSAGCDYCGRTPDDPIHQTIPATITQETRFNLNNNARVHLTPEGIERATFAMMQIKTDEAGPYIEEQLYRIMHVFGPALAFPGFAKGIYTNIVLLPPSPPPTAITYGRKTPTRRDLVETAARTLEKHGWSAADVAELRAIGNQVDRWIL
jgi:hypothetical protein